MPNHITNRITVVSGHYDLNKIESFNEVAPMPEELADITHDGLIMNVGYFIEGRVPLPELLERFPSEDDQRKTTSAIDRFMKYGAVSWYDWSIKNWGTKWDMYDRRCEDNVLIFDTAWSCPVPWFKKLASTLPDGVTLKIEYADEDIGRNAGHIIASNKVFEGHAYKNGSDEAWELAIELKDCHYYQKINGKWVYVGDDNE